MSDSELTPEMAAAAREALTELAKLIDPKTPPESLRCPICKKSITRRSQVGGCVYMDPCGHHYRGKLK